MDVSSLNFHLKTAHWKFQLNFRCRIRKQLFQQRIKIADVVFVLAILGLAITIIDTEITALSYGITQRGTLTRCGQLN